MPPPLFFHLNAAFSAMQAARQNTAPVDYDDESGMAGQDASGSWEKPVAPAGNSCLSVESQDTAANEQMG